MRPSSLVGLALGVLFAGCGDASPGASRSYWLAASGTQLVVTGPQTGFLLTEANLAEDVEVVAIHQEFYGVPWDAFAAPQAPPAGWAARMADLAGFARGERPLIAEAGWLSTPLVAQGASGQCVTALTSDESVAAAYLDRLLNDAERAGMELVTWISDRDVLLAPLMTDCGCHQSAEWCAVRDLFRGPPPSGTVDTQLQGELMMKAFGAMGLRTYDGAARTAVLGRWEQARRLPVAGP